MIELPSIFSHGMVITKNARIWGWAEADTRITIDFIGKSYTVTASGDGRFEAVLLSEAFGGPYELTINQMKIQDVYVGHVWLCGGQSNMEQPISRTRPLLDAYIKDAPQIRAFQAEKGLCFDGPRQDAKGSWRAATGDFLEDIFAVPYFFALALEKDVPIGLINIAAGGTPAEAWLPEEAVREFPNLYEKLLPHKQPGYTESREAESAAKTQAWQATLHANDIGIKEGWHSPDYNHDHWSETMLLDQADLPAHGAVWYRKDVFLSEDAAPAYLSLGRAAGSATVYVNGEPVIEVPYQYPPCRGIIPAGLLKAGKNTIAVRAVGATTMQHFVPGKPYKLIHEGGAIDLLGPWKCQTGHSMPPAEPALWLYNIPCGTYNYMLAPVLGYGIDGAIWYQGESNTPEPMGYKPLFEAFVKNMRRHFGDNLPVIFTQLANYMNPDNNGENWAVLRGQQLKCLSIPNTAMAVAIDCGEYNDLHPQDKKTVGQRLALCARRLAYGEAIVSSGPMAKAATFRDVRNEEVVISFDYGEGLWVKNGRPMLEIIDSLGKLHYFYGEIDGEAIRVNTGPVTPEIIRFGWTDCPSVFLYNAYNLPASPFSIALTPQTEETMTDVLIIGGGPAGVSAALYTARAGLKTKIIHKGIGALEKAERIDNFYGSPGLTGAELVQKGLAHAAEVGAEVITGEVVKIKQHFDNDMYFTVESTGTSHTARTILLATGASRQSPDIPDLAEYEGKGVSHCAICDAFFYKGKDVAVLGHSRYALSEAKELLPLVKSMHVLTDGKEPEVIFPPEVTVHTKKIQQVQGESRLAGVMFEDGESLPIDGLFIALGTAGATDLARTLGALVENNAVLTDENMGTHVPGLWAAGDCTPGIKQIAKAVYEGAKAGMDIINHLRRTSQ